MTVSKPAASERLQEVDDRCKNLKSLFSDLEPRLPSDEMSRAENFILTADLMIVDMQRGGPTNRASLSQIGSELLGAEKILSQYKREDGEDFEAAKELFDLQKARFVKILAKPEFPQWYAGRANNLMNQARREMERASKFSPEASYTGPIQQIIDYLAEVDEILANDGAIYSFPLPLGFPKKIGKPTGEYAHENFPECKYAVDFITLAGTPVVASRNGTVIKIKSDSDKCGLDKSLADEANYVCIEHSDGTFAEYVHLGRGKQNVVVGEGQWVEAGNLLGYTGMSGYMSTPHLYFNVFKMEGNKAIGLKVFFNGRYR